MTTDRVFILQNNDAGRFRMILEYNDEKCIQFDCPDKVNQVDDKFTIFWRGHTNQELLSNIANHCRKNTDKNFRILCFFENGMLYNPSQEFKDLPTTCAPDIIKQYGAPVFLRYELYTDSKKPHDIQNCRIAFWATLSSQKDNAPQKETDNEIGVYISYKDFIAQSHLDELCSFIEQTIFPKTDLDFNMYLSKIAYVFHVQNFSDSKTPKFQSNNKKYETTKGSSRWVRSQGI